VDLARTEGVGAVHRHQQSIRKRAEGLQRSLLLEHLQDFFKNGKYLRWFDRVEQRPNLLVTGDLMHPKQTLGVTAPFAALHPALVGQKRRGLGEEYAKCAQSGIFHPITTILASTLVR
jgi:hypothetical protein